MSIETNKTHLEAGSFKALKNVADVARQVMLGEEQEKLEIQELVNIISAAKYLDENQKTAIIEIFGLSKAEKEKKKKDFANSPEGRAIAARELERHRKKIDKEQEEKRKEREKVHAQDRADREKRGPVGDRGGRIAS